MGYFSSGTEGMDYVDRYCRRCVHGQDADRGEYACAVWLAHHEHNYAECNKKDSILHLLIPRSADGLSNEQCRMFLEADRELSPAASVTAVEHAFARMQKARAAKC